MSPALGPWERVCVVSTGGEGGGEEREGVGGERMGLKKERG